ncbi:MAG: DUF4238 domain-containing protein [Candidatus Aminicenantales bacterium]
MGHHYVPRKYLRGFADPNNPGKIWMYDKHSHRFTHASIISVAQEASYYSEDAERQLSEFVEGPAHKVLKKLRCGDSINDNERMRLALYVATMLMRVPRRRRKAFEMLPSVREDVINRATLIITQWAKTSMVAPALKLKRFAELERAREKLRAQPPEEVVKKIRAPWPSEKVLACVIGMTWRIASAGDAGFFLTSDNPAFFFEAYGLGRPESELTFPLASELALLGSWQGAPNETIFVKAKPSLMKEVNRRIASGAERFVFYRGREDWVAQLAERRNLRLNRIIW